MKTGIFERFEEWSWRLYRVEPERLRREARLRVVLLRRLLAATGAAGVLYVALELTGTLSNSRQIFPFVFGTSTEASTEGSSASAIRP